MNKYEMTVNDAYNTILLRSPDKSGMNTYLKHVMNGMTFDKLCEILKSSQEYLDLVNLRKSIDTIHFRYVVRCKYINVGLPRTGTQSLDFLVENQLGFKAGHLLPHDETTIKNFVENKDSLIHRSLYDYDFLSDIPMFYHKIIKTLLQRYPNIKLICTTRHKEKWLNSIKRNFVKAETIHKIMQHCNSNTLENVYDNHCKLIDQYSIPTFDLDNQNKEVLSNFFESSVIFPKVDNIKKSGVKNSSHEIFLRHKNDLH